MRIAKTDQPGLHWAHTHFVGFVMRRLNFFFYFFLSSVPKLVPRSFGVFSYLSCGLIEQSCKFKSIIKHLKEIGVIVMAIFLILIFGNYILIHETQKIFFYIFFHGWKMISKNEKESIDLFSFKVNNVSPVPQENLFWGSPRGWVVEDANFKRSKSLVISPLWNRA